MTHLEEQLKRIHLSPAQENFFRQVATIDNDKYLDASDTTAAVRHAAVQLAKDVLEGKPLYQVFINTAGEEKSYRIRPRQLKLDLGGYVYTDNWAVNTFDFAVLFGVAMKTVYVNNDLVLNVSPEGAILFNEALLSAQWNYVESAFAIATADKAPLNELLPMIFAYIKGVLLVKQKVRVPKIDGEFDDVRRRLSKYIPKRSTWTDYLQFYSVKLPFDGPTGPVDLLASLTDITVDSLPGTQLYYKSLGGQCICLQTLQEVEQPAITDGIFTAAHDAALLTPELLYIDTPEREQELYNLFQFYHKG